MQQPLKRWTNAQNAARGATAEPSLDGKAKIPAALAIGLLAGGGARARGGVEIAPWQKC